MRLYNGVRYIDKPSPVNINRLDMAALPMVQEFHSNGILVDTGHLSGLESTIKAQRQSLLNAIIASPGVGRAYQDHKATPAGVTITPFNPASPDHVERLLFQHLKLQDQVAVELRYSARGRASVDDDTLSAFDSIHPAVGYIREDRELAKILGTYVMPLQQYAHASRDGRVRTTFSATTASTGRLSSLDPNLMNIPTRTALGKSVRAAFVSRRGYKLLSVDLSQIEMVWAAHLSQDQNMMDIFRRGDDIHDWTACQIFGVDLDRIKYLRRVSRGAASKDEELELKDFVQNKRLPCKTMGFGILYGQTPQGLQATIVMSGGPHWPLERCEEFVKDWFKVFPRIQAFMQLQHSRAAQYGMVWCAFGRPRLIPEAKSVHKRIRNEGFRKAGNHPEQASAQGTIKLAMAAIYDVIVDMFGLGTIGGNSAVCPLLQIHDELIFEVRDDVVEDWRWMAKQCMEEATPLSVPVRSSADVAEKWSELK
jgi:DNA polymerase I